MNNIVNGNIGINLNDTSFINQLEEEYYDLLKVMNPVDALTTIRKNYEIGKAQFHRDLVPILDRYTEKLIAKKKEK
jgi:hypothetical protein